MVSLGMGFLIAECKIWRKLDPCLSQKRQEWERLTLEKGADRLMMQMQKI